VHVHHLRRKLGNQRIRTVRGVGYAFAPPPSSEAPLDAAQAGPLAQPMD